MGLRGRFPPFREGTVAVVIVVAAGKIVLLCGIHLCVSTSSASRLSTQIRLLGQCVLGCSFGVDVPPLHQENSLDVSDTLLSAPILSPFFSPPAGPSPCRCTETPDKTLNSLSSERVCDQMPYSGNISVFLLKQKPYP